MAKRDKLTQKQKRQVARKHSQRLRAEESTSRLSDLSPPKEGLLVSRYGNQADVVDIADMQKYRCHLRQNLGAPVPGDQVNFRLDSNNHGIVEAIHQRQSILQRPAQHQGVKPIVANISRIFIVVAPLPDFSATLLDRYLVAVTDANIAATIVINKWDLVDEIKQQNIESQLSIYQNLDYPIIKVSSETGLGIDTLKDSAINQKSILVGQSGVGKSSIINCLFPTQKRQVNVISQNSRLGQHTTTSSLLFLFEQRSGFIIDSPGVREFGLWHMDQPTIADGFIEFADYLGTCKFRDCKHVNEPGCEIISAVKQQKINHQRWRNYCKIISAPA